MPHRARHISRAEPRREEARMTDQQRIKYLRYALRVFGAIMVFGFYPLTIVWPRYWTGSSTNVSPKVQPIRLRQVRVVAAPFSRSSNAHGHGPNSRPRSKASEYS